MAFWILGPVLPDPMSVKQAKQPNKQVHKVCYSPVANKMWQFMKVEG